jgi:hypothetical protein
MTGTIITGTTHTSITLTSTASNPVSVTSTAEITPTSANIGALYGEQGKSWTITNVGLISDGTNGNGIQLGRSSNYVGASIITNQTGGTISGVYGIRVYNSAASSITNQTSASIIAIQQTANTGSAVYMYGSGTVTNFGTITAPTSNSNSRGVLLENGGVIINNSTGTITGAVGILINGIGTVTNAGTIKAGGTAGTAVHFSTSGANRLIVDPNAAFYGGVVGGSGGLELASGASAGTLTATNFTGFNAIDFDSGSQWTLSGSSSALTGVITGFTTNDTIDLTGFFATAASYSTVTHNLTLTNSIQAHETLHFSGGPFSNGTVPVTTNATGTVLTDQVCFVAGTCIATLSGEVPVEQLAVGDLVLTYHGEAKPIVWIGTGRTLVTRGRRNAAKPVIVRKNAIADNVPHRDLHVTKGHALYFSEDDVLIPAEFLVNHRSIVWDDRALEVEIYHIELETHDVLLANGAPAESYRDDGNRWLFGNANTGRGQPVKPHYAMVQTGGPSVDAIWRSLRERSGLRLDVATTGEADLHLLVDGRRLDGRPVGTGVHVFRLPRSPRSVRVASRAGAQDELGLARDPRRLGVALGRVMLWQGRHVKVIEADNELLCDGFHAFEVDNGFRWTNGDALLPGALFDGVGENCILELHVACTAQYPLSENQAGIIT